jgi:hypothetical protein
MTDQQAAAAPEESATSTEESVATEQQELAPAEQQAEELQESAPVETESDKVQQRINKVTRDKHEAIREAERLRSEIEQLRQQTAPAEELGAMPTLESCDFDEAAFQQKTAEYFRKSARQEAQAVLQEHSTTQQQQAAQTEAQRQTDEYIKRAGDFAKDNQDYDATFDNLMSVLQNPEVGKAILASNNGPAIAYHLGKNLDKVEALNGMNSVNAVLEVANIGITLGAPAKKQTTTAPDPPETISGGGQQGLKKLSEMSMSEFMNRDKSIKYPE